jgi:hypothetical protein
MFTGISMTTIGFPQNTDGPIVNVLYFRRMSDKA